METEVQSTLALLISGFVWGFGNLDCDTTLLVFDLYCAVI